MYKTIKIKGLKDKFKKSQISILQTIAGFHLMSWRPCWCTLNKRILIISFVWDTNMAAISIVLCVSWDCVKTKNWQHQLQSISWRRD